MRIKRNAFPILLCFSLILSTCGGALLPWATQPPTLIPSLTATPAATLTPSTLPSTSAQVPTPTQIPTATPTPTPSQTPTQTPFPPSPLTDNTTFHLQAQVGGSIASVALLDQTVYVGIGSRLAALDVSNPSTPLLSCGYERKDIYSAYTRTGREAWTRNHVIDRIGNIQESSG